ncbi:bifunctional diguanylate cyclase/phosphodiesterase [Mycobacterium sp. GA-2829]|uniref:putative bifunctional diguanylate cyclase/phosphodiesterase n=1 Tax=Mycobacterium sp. GA-2829 TaxID=1772283 RepID=UPI00073FF449|nr:bifunctional diguanylate cyclase/phosphodiesterase [Mycobacterium sp. GA-2829]KUI28426.1 diguanylate phosphodiesterase [Mycobacterium sp. GA-2829]
MSVKNAQRRLAIFVLVAALAWLNAFALYGDDVARGVAVAMQAPIGITALVAAVVVARRNTGVSRWWRVLVAGAMLSWLVGEVVWFLSGAGSRGDPAPTIAVVAYFMPPVLSLAAMIVLARGGGGLRGRGGSLRHSRAVAILDGAVAATAFAILAFIAGLGAMTGAALPRSQNVHVVVAYSLLELAVVVVAALMAMAYRRDRPDRVNYLLLSGGVLTIAASDRFVAYLQTVGVESGDLWGGVGFTLGPLIILYALLQTRPLPASGRGQEAMDWLQTFLPYIGFLFIIGLLSFHLLIGEPMPVAVIFAAVAMIGLVTARQVVAMRAQRLLTRQLFEAQARLAHQVHHDALTGLPNRLLFARRLDEAVATGRFVLIFVDIDDFKEVNDKFGHAAGDELLCAVGDRLRQCVGPSDTLARIGGDEFAILVQGEEAPEVVADKLRVALRDPFAIHGSTLKVRASMGLVRPSADDPAPTSDDLLRKADISMYAGKRLGKDTAVVYRASAEALVDFPSALREADGDAPPGFCLAYQPVVRLPDAAPVAVEALARWSAPNGMQIPPETFVAVAEGAGLGAALDTLVLNLACKEVQEAGLDLILHVNIGAARLGNRAFEEEVKATLDRHGLEPDRLVLEITETVPIVDLPRGAAAIKRLRAMGVKVALDDFGTGFNSLSYLHALPVDVVKLDRSLAAEQQPERDLALYRSVIGLCDALGLHVIAEGIEYAEQADTVLAAGCRLAQGHLFGRAMPLEDVCELVAESRANAVI